MFGVQSLFQQNQTVVAEGRKGGEATAKSGGEQKPYVGSQVETGGKSIKHAYQETAYDVDGEGGPGKVVGHNAFVQGQLHAVAEYASRASAKKNTNQCFCHCSVLTACWE